MRTFRPRTILPRNSAGLSGPSHTPGPSHYYYLRGMAAVHRWNREANKEALQLFHRATELDPDFASAYGMAARCYSQRKVSGWVSNRPREIAEAERLARRAAELGKDDAVAICTAGLSSPMWSATSTKVTS